MRHLLTSILLVLLLGPGVAHAQSGDRAPGTSEGWWTTAYLVDYGLIAVGAGAYLALAGVDPNPNPPLGPSFDPDDPTELLKPEYEDDIGRPYADLSTLGLGETVPSGDVVVMIGAAGGLMALEEALYWGLSPDGSARRFHDTLVGFAEVVALNGGLTEATKVAVGRLRPDFQDRLRRYLCQTDPPSELDCTGVRPLAESEEEAEHVLVDGRKSFFSGHSSFAAAIAAYTALVIGGRWVWNEDATAVGRSLGILLQTAVVASGLFIAASRLDDGRHHATDVFVGSTVGLGLANLSYWRRFDGTGEPIDWKRPERTARVRLGPGPANGLSLTVTY
jgi:membrane-associated phospholipid phosphatase